MDKELFLAEVKDEGGYQDITVRGEVLHNGWRSCAERWEIIKGAIGKGNAILDFGSHYGYFALKAAEQGNVVLSIEGDARRANIQRVMLKMNEEETRANVVLLEKQMGFQDWFGLYRTCEGIDTILALSVLHYVPSKELFDTLWLFSNIAPNLIVEFPPLEETGVASYGNVKEFGDFTEKLRMFYSDVEPLGEAVSPSNQNIKRQILRASNSKIFKSGISGFLSYEKFGKKHRLVYFNGEWKLDEANDTWRKGFNCRTLFELGKLVYPTKEELLHEISIKYLEIIAKKFGNVTDISSRNALVTEKGIEIIDFNEQVGENIYGVTWEEYKEKILNFTLADLDEVLKSRND